MQTPIFHNPPAHATRTNIATAKRALELGESVWVYMVYTGIWLSIENEGWEKVTAISDPMPVTWDDNVPLEEDSGWDITLESGEVYPVSTESGWEMLGSAIYIEAASHELQPPAEAPKPVIFKRKS